MTTIAANRECMAADSRVSCGDGSAFYNAKKIFRIGSFLYGTAGHGDMSLVLIDWLRTARNRQALYKQLGEYEREEAWVLELGPAGLALWTGWGVQERLLDQRYAIGSGQLAALKGMDRGEPPEEAVKGAIDYDQYTGGIIQVEYLLPPELKRNSRRKRG